MQFDGWVGVIGAGTMGAQIALQAALHGVEVRLTDADPARLTTAIEGNTALLQRRVDKGKLAPVEMGAALARVQVQRELAGTVTGAALVVEAVVEDVRVKRAVFGQIAALTDSDTVLASNSSTIGISQIVEGLTCQARSLNLHFFHPVLVMRLVEVMRGPLTEDWAVAQAVAFAYQIEREPVIIQRELYGLLVNRILGAIKREAFWLAEQGYAEPADIDRAVKLGLNHPMGPFELTDFSGLDVFYGAAMQRYRETGDEANRPSRILAEKVAAGHLGRKTGQGFYRYPRPDENDPSAK